MNKSKSISKRQSDSERQRERGKSALNFKCKFELNENENRVQSTFLFRFGTTKLFSALPLTVCNMVQSFSLFHAKKMNDSKYNILLEKIWICRFEFAQLAEQLRQKKFVLKLKRMLFVCTFIRYYVPISKCRDISLVELCFFPGLEFCNGHCFDSHNRSPFSIFRFQFDARRHQHRTIEWHNMHRSVYVKNHDSCKWTKKKKKIIQPSYYKMENGFTTGERIWKDIIIMKGLPMNEPEKNNQPNHITLSNSLFFLVRFGRWIFILKLSARRCIWKRDALHKIAFRVVYAVFRCSMIRSLSCKERGYWMVLFSHFEVIGDATKTNP